MPKRLKRVLNSSDVRLLGTGRYVDGEGLHLFVRKSGARSWVFRFMIKGKSRDIGLGSAGEGGVSLAAARRSCARLRRQVKAGMDPELIRKVP